MTIPISALVQAIPGVVSAGGTSTSLNGLFLTNNARVPIGTVLSLSSTLAVLNYFGAASAEYAKAQVYFGGYQGCTKYPGAMLWAQYPSAAVAAWLRGGSVVSAGLTTIKAITGSLSITVDGNAWAAASLSLSGCASFSAVATAITSALTGTGTGPTVTYDSVSGGFVVTSGTAGSGSTITVATGTAAAGLYLTTATGAILSQGAAAATPGTFMSALIQVNSSWAAFTHIFDPDVSGNTNKVAFAAWTSAQSNRYLYVPADSDTTPTTTNPATSSLGYLCGTSGNNYSGTAPIYQPSDLNGPAFVLGYGASLDFNATNGRATAMFRNQSGLAAGVTSSTARSDLIANGYNFVGSYGNSSQTWTFVEPGQVSGPFLWLDSFLGQIWLNSSLQNAVLTAFVSIPSFPYNADGYGLIEAACTPVLAQFLKYGGCRKGVILSASEIAAVNSVAGVDIASTLSQQGYVLRIADPGATVRAARGTPICTLWYVDGQSIQSIVVNSLLVQ